MPRRSNPLTYLALGWLGLLVLAANAGVSVPDGFGTTVFFLTICSVGFLYFWACRRRPIAGWLMLGFFVGLFGGSNNSVATTSDMSIAKRRHRLRRRMSLTTQRRTSHR